MWVSTFHSSCVRILRREIGRFGYGSNFSIYDDADSRRLMTLVCVTSTSTPSATPRAALNWVCNCKNELLDPEAGDREGRDAARANLRRVRTSSTRGGCTRPTRSTSTT